MNKTKKNKWVRLVVALIFFGACISVKAQKIARYYTSSLQNTGMLYFIKPQAGFSANKGKDKFSYDITAYAKTDSLTLNFTFLSAAALHISSLDFNSAGTRFSPVAHKLYVETKKLKWQYRYSVRISQADLRRFFSEVAAPTLSLNCQEGNVSLQIPKRKWDKIAARNRRIFELMALN